VKGAKSVSVTLDDGTELPAKVVGTDPRTDIAVLKVAASKPLPYIELGNSRDVKPGEWVVAMGNPFGLGGTVTAGIVSAVSRDIGAGPYDQFIQVDAPINQGNSGGPLFTQDGKVIGMNTAILSPTGGSVGIGFAIPSDMIRTVEAQLAQNGHMTRGYVGVSTQGVTPAMAKALRLQDGRGALVASVEPDSPAAKAGLQPGDVILGLDGRKITTPRDLAIDVAHVKPGSEAKFDILRDGGTQTVTVAVAAMQNERTADRGATDAGEARVGVSLAPLTPEVRGQLEVPARTNGAVVAEVQPGSPAEQAGLREGDVIVSVGSQAIGSPDEAARAIRSAAKKDQAVALRIFREGRSAFVAIDMAKADEARPNQG
jgi:serine protease Do